MRLLTVIFFAIIFQSSGVNNSHAAIPNDQCGVYIRGSTPVAGNQPSVISDDFLSDLDSATPCLISIINSLKSDVGPGGISKDASARLLAVTGAFRTIMTRLVASDKAANTTTNLDSFISTFRKIRDIDTVSVLSYGTRSEISDLRLNSLSILGNVIDNPTVCVALAHLNDPTLLDSPNGNNGRANLLGTISVVAPWAYKENFENITRTAKAITDSINRDDPNLKYTVYALSNINDRLASQKPNSNRSVPMPSNWRMNCRTYVQNFVPKIVTIDNVRY